MRLIIILLILLVSFCQSPALSKPCAVKATHFSIETAHHSNPLNPKQENREEEDEDLTDEDEDFSADSLISRNDLAFSFFYQQIIFSRYFLVGKSNAHINPILTPHDHLC
jgi:hypothetical protein